MLVDLRPFDAALTGKAAQEALDRRRDHPQQESDPRRPPIAVRHQRAPDRHSSRHHGRHGRAGDGRDRPPDRPGAAPAGRRGRSGGRSRGRRDPLLEVPAVPLIRAGAPRINGYRDYVIVGLVAAVATWSCTFVVRRLAVRFSIIVLPDDRRVHDRATPTLGGAAMYLGLLIAIVVASQLSGLERAVPRVVRPDRPGAGGLGDLRRRHGRRSSRDVAAGEDVRADPGRHRALPVRHQHAVLPAAVRRHDRGAVRRPRAGRHRAVGGRDGQRRQPRRRAGRAGGRDRRHRRDSHFSSTHTSWCTPGRSGPTAPVRSSRSSWPACASGSCPTTSIPARIFMGDAGALLLGLLMAASTMSVVGQTDNDFTGRTYFFFAPVVIPFFILGIPILDTAFAIIRRAGRRASPSEADKNHLHHRLMRLGHGQARSVLILWAWTALLSALVLYPVLANRSVFDRPLRAGRPGCRPLHPLRRPRPGRGSGGRRDPGGGRDPVAPAPAGPGDEPVGGARAAGARAPGRTDASRSRRSGRLAASTRA